MHNNIIQVLDLRDSPWIDGPGRTILQCADMIDQQKCNICIGAFTGVSHNEHAYFNKARQLGLDVIEIKENKSFDWNVVSQIKAAINSRAIDIIHTHDFRSNIYGLICSKSLGIPLVSTCHGWISNNLKGKVYTTVDKYLIRYHDRVITVSEIMKQHLTTRGISADRIQVINNALIISDYIIDNNNKFRNEFDIHPDNTVVANIGRLSPEKRQDLFLRAAKYICEVNQNYIFVIIGVGPEKENLVRLTKELGIEKNVIFTGFRDDMVDIYNGVDLVVQSSNTEGMPNVILESLLMGIPVIATDVGGTTQIVQHNKNGYLIEAENLDDIKEALFKYNKETSRFNEMGRAGRDFVINNFNHDIRVKKLLDVYQDMIS